MTNLQEEYFADTSSISNSQLRNFVSYNKYWDRLLTPDIYRAYSIDKAMEFEITDPIIVWKIVDLYFDWTWEMVWDKYQIVARRSWENPNEITKTIAKTAKRMIDWGNYFPKFQEFIKDKNTASQYIIRETIKCSEKDTWEVYEIPVKWLPDFINQKDKVICDLKTSWNMDMIIEGLQYKWEPNLTANYIRQLAMYNKMMWGDYSWALALITEKGIKWIDVPNEILIEAWKIIEQDLIELWKYIQDPKDIDESIFNLEELSL